MQHRGIRLLAVLAVGALALTACGGDDSGSAAGDTTTAPAADTTTAAPETTTSAPAATGPTITVTPDSGLSDGDVVTIEGSGYTPGVGLGVNQCADEDDPDQGITSTGAGECNLGAILPIDADDAGNVMAEFTVSGGPFGASEIVCDATHDCVISVGELSAEPDAERSTVKITFG